MGKKIIVLSLGGSLIFPGDIGYSYLKKFRRVINKNKSKYKFIIVCGGGSLARKYINAIKKDKGDLKFQSLSGISATRNNARFMNYFFRKEPKKGIPLNISEVRSQIKNKDVIFCGALGYKPEQTTDSNAAQISKEFNTIFINLTDVDGLYDKNPKKYEDAKLIKKISWKDFHKKALKLKYEPGQHFVLDQKASKIIMENKIPTYIIGNTKEFDNFLNNKDFRGTSITV